MPETLFISDLHLSEEQPAVTGLFLHFLGERAREADSLYILGDLFDAWIGDDDPRPLATGIKAALRALSDSGVRIFIQAGNRDFLLGHDFMAAAGCTLLPDIRVIELAGAPTLLLHGDLLCTGDRDYQQARAFLRSEAFRSDFLSKTIAERRAIAADYRRRSGEATSLKAGDIMDVDQETVADTMRRHGVLRLIHGHTHRPGIHDFELDGRPAQRIVLADWHPDHGALLRVTGNTIETGAVLPPA
ncbi:MAG TPA: UDP-2,3-diacylglucosamine diphosphatase [Sedimenticola sp.]|nr:UDP-2,3-diacylglucosamine diphosphatase [Sedimenticola sp.]